MIIQDFGPNLEYCKGYIKQEKTEESQLLCSILNFQQILPKLESRQNSGNASHRLMGDTENLIKTEVYELTKENSKEEIQTNLSIQASRTFPMIDYDFIEERKQTKYKHFIEDLNDIKTVKNTSEIFEQMLDQGFHKMEHKYYNLTVFAIQRGKQINIDLNKDHFNLEKDHEVMFYMKRCKGLKKQVIFTIFDKFQRSIEFNGDFIDKNKQKYPDEYSLYQNFCKQIFTEEKQIGKKLTNSINNQEIKSDENNDDDDDDENENDIDDNDDDSDDNNNDDSDDDESDNDNESDDEDDNDNYDDDQINLEQKSVDYFKGQLNKLLDKDLTSLQNQIQKLNLEIATIDQSEEQQQILMRLGDQLEYLQENKSHFQSTRQTVIQEMIKFQTKQNSQLQFKEFYKRVLKKMILINQQLQCKEPFIRKKPHIFKLLNQQNLLIIEGETGLEKSTRLPQMLCQFYELLDNPKALPVLITQPGSLAIKILAERVAKELGKKIGEFVDYIASAGRRVNQNAKIIFKLDRMVLEELAHDPVLSNYSCLVINEAHERTISIDIILGLVKQLLKKRTDFKVIVTSASMDSHPLESYFETKILKVQERRMYPVTVTYKNYAKQKQGNKLQQVHKIQRIINEQILHDNSSMKNQFKGHLLCFCSNLDELNELINIYSEKLNRNIFAVYALHDKITPVQQKIIFQDTNKYKFIFASSIRETDIIIDGVKVVIDSGKDVELVYDQTYQSSSIKLKETTQSAAQQRTQKLGTNEPGHCFRLYSQQNLKQRKVNKVPQMQTVSLQTVILRMKALKISDVINFPYLSKPNMNKFEKSIKLLKLIGALTGKDNKITKIGELMTQIPIEPLLSRAIVEGTIFQKSLQMSSFYYKLKLPKQQLSQLCTENIENTVIQIISMVVNHSDLFVNERNEQGDRKKIEFSDEDGDFFFLYNIFKRYKQMKEQGCSQDRRNRKLSLTKWIQENNLNFQVLNQTEYLVRYISQIVKQFSIKYSVYEEEYDNAQSKLMECKSYREIILSCLITSFSSNLCKYSGNPQIGYTMVNQRKPLQVYETSNLLLLGIPSDWIICYDLYTNQMGKLFCKVAHAITFDFMKKHIDRYIWQMFKVSEIQKLNPFYRELRYNVPTKILQQLRSDYYQSETDQRFMFLKDAIPMIFQEQNKILFFLMVQEKYINFGKNKVKDEQSSNYFQKEITGYLQNLKKELIKPYKYNHMDNILINIQNGYHIQSIKFNNIQPNIQIDNIQFCIEITSESAMIQTIAAEVSIKQFGKYFIEDCLSTQNIKKSKGKKKSVQKHKRKIEMFIMEEENKNMLLIYINQLRKAKPSIEMDIKESLVNKRMKIPQTKITLHFFAGKCVNANAFLFYEDTRNGNPAQKMCEKIKQGIKKINSLQPIRGLIDRNPFKFLQASLKVNQKGNGINLFHVDCDQLQIADQLFKMDQQRLFGLDFIFPKCIKKFRSPQINQACKDDNEWKEEIQSLLEEINVNTQNLSISIRGSDQSDRNNKESMQKTQLRVDMIAEITTIDQSIVLKMKNALDGKTDKLGCQKLHIRVYYEQVVAMPSLKIFQALEEEYEYQINKFKISYPLLSFITINRRVRNKEKIMIISRSPKKQDFTQTQRIIINLFTSKLIKLQFLEQRFLDCTNNGRKILDDIEEEYNFKVHFEFEKFDNSIKVYCEDKDSKRIEAKIKEIISKKSKQYTEKISYRGKNLNKVKKLLDDKIKFLSRNKMLSYQIIFQQREVIVTTDIATFQQIKDDIMKFVAGDKKKCGICADIMRNPYRFLNCQCQFCWLCLTNHLRVFRNRSYSQMLLCPNNDCKTPINMNDVKTLLSQDQFQILCNAKIRNYIKQKRDKYVFCNYCPNIFDKKVSQKSGVFNCGICGKIECVKCGQSHPNYSCEQWKYEDKYIINKQSVQIENEDKTKSVLKKLAVKKCPLCQQYIQKIGGCNQMKCKNCKIHICWKCSRIFKTSTKCYDHLTKECGGILDQGVYD